MKTYKVLFANIDYTKEFLVKIKTDMSIDFAERWGNAHACRMSAAQGEAFFVSNVVPDSRNFVCPMSAYCFLERDAPEIVSVEKRAGRG